MFHILGPPSLKFLPPLLGILIQI